MTHIAGYRRPYPGTQPNHLHPPYVSSIKRAPLRPLVRIPHTLTEITGPQFGSESVDPKDCDLTRQHADDHIFNCTADEKARSRLISVFDWETTIPEWALGYRFDIILRGREATPWEE